MAWLLLILAGVFETVWAFYMKLSEGFTRAGPTLVMLGAMLVSFGLLSLAMRTLPLGTAYAVWTGIGAVGAFVLGILLLGEQVSALRLIAAGMIVSGIVLMKVADVP